MSAVVKSVDWTGQNLPFAVGSFHFGLNGKPPGKFSLADYVAWVTAALNRLPAINNVKIELGEGDDHSVVLEEEPPSHEDGSPFPFPHFFSVEFDLFIPVRIQDELMHEKMSDRTGTENFKIYLTHHFYSPICFVVPKSPASSASPSSSVPIVREYLRREINGKGGNIKFEALGPSPMHANFILFGKPPANGKAIAVNHIKQHGYDDVIVLADPSQFRSINECFDHVRYSMSHEVDDFYYIKQLDVRSYRAWSDIQALVESVVQRNEDEGIVARLASFWRRSKDIGRLHELLVGFDARLSYSRNDVDRSIKKLYGKSEVEFIRPLIEEEIEDRGVFPTEHIGRLVEFLERRRSKAFELFVVLSASLIGGAAGALVTTLLRAQGGP